MGDTGPSRLGHKELPQGQPRISCVFSGQCQSRRGTLLDGVGPGVTRKPHDPRSPLFWEAAPQARPTCGAAPAEPADLGFICGGRGGGLWSWSHDFRPHPTTAPFPSSQSGPTLQPLRGRVRGPSITREINAALMYYFQAGGGALHKRCIVSMASSRLPPQHPARWRRPQRRAGAETAAGEGVQGEVGPLSSTGEGGMRGQHGGRKGRGREGEG